MDEDMQDHPGPADLMASLERSDADIAAGRVRPLADVIQSMRARTERMKAREDQDTAEPAPRVS